jgi:hypothetical protein
LRGGAGGGGVCGKGGGGGRGEKWTKPCTHIWIIKEKRKKKKTIPASLGWNQLDHAAWYFCYVVECGLLSFYWIFCI